MAPELKMGVSFWVTAWAMGGLSVDRPKTIESLLYLVQLNLAGYDTHLFIPNN